MGLLIEAEVIGTTRVSRILYLMVEVSGRPTRARNGGAEGT